MANENSDKVKLSSIYPNPDNPRVVRNEAFKKLCNSITEFPQMMALRPMVIDEKRIILGGNMRYKALEELGFKEIPATWVKEASELTEEQKKRFIIADNVGFGEWNWEELKDGWGTDELEDWGLVFPDFSDVKDDPDFTSQNKEIDVDDFEDKVTLKLSYDSETFSRVKAALYGVHVNPEQALLNILKIKPLEDE